MKKVKHWLLVLWLAIPFGSICKFKYGELYITLRKDMWLVISDGHSNDMLPITMVSQKLADRVGLELERLGYGTN